MQNHFLILTAFNCEEDITKHGKTCLTTHIYAFKSDSDKFQPYGSTIFVMEEQTLKTSE